MGDLVACGEDFGSLCFKFSRRLTFWLRFSGWLKPVSLARSSCAEHSELAPLADKRPPTQFATPMHYVLHQLRMNFFDRGHVAAGSAVELDWDFAFDGEADVFEHLAVAQFDHQDFADFAGSVAQGLLGERPQGNGPEQSGLEAFAAGHFDGRAQHARGDAVADKQDFGVFGLEGFMTSFDAGGADVLGFELANVVFEIVGLEENRADQVLAGFLRALDGPGLFGELGLAVGRGRAAPSSGR